MRALFAEKVPLDRCLDAGTPAAREFFGLSVVNHFVANQFRRDCRSRVLLSVVRQPHRRRREKKESASPGQGPIRQSPRKALVGDAFRTQPSQLGRCRSTVRTRLLKLNRYNSIVPLSEPHVAALVLRPWAKLSAQPDDTKVRATCSRLVFAMPAFCGDGRGLKGR